MSYTLLCVLSGLTMLGLGGLVFVLRIRTHQSVERVVEAVHVAAEDGASPPTRRESLGSLPAPVRRYLKHVLPKDERQLQSVRLEQRGHFRDAERAASWRSFTATQHVAGSPPAFVWDAYIRMMPGMSLRVVDAYHGGHGTLRASLAGLITMLDVDSSPELDEGELMRYLAETPLYPMVLLPGHGVTWSAIDDRSARATLQHEGTTASLVFHFNERDEVERVTGLRDFMNEDGTFELRPWRGCWRNYQVWQGVRIPTAGKVAWVEPEGEVSYWKAHLTKIDYDFQPRPVPGQGRSLPSSPWPLWVSTEA